MKKTFVSADEVAALAGVSRSAVSRTFTPGASVSEATRRRVTLAADSLGYHVNQLASALGRARNNIVCLIVSELDTPYRSAMLRALTQKLQDAGQTAMLINTDRSQSGLDAALRQTLRFRADASILLSGQPDRSIVKSCIDSGQQLVLINRDDPMPGPVRINVDENHSAALAVDGFVRAGCQRLAFANSAVGTPSLLARQRAFVTHAETAGLAVEVVAYGATLYQSGFELAQILLNRIERPDGVFCVNDLIACGFMDAARHRFGLDIPRDLCVMGFDDIEQAGWSSYDLTTFRQPIEQIAELAVAALNTDTPADALIVRAPMIWRGSVRNAPSNL